MNIGGGDRLGRACSYGCELTVLLLSTVPRVRILPVCQARCCENVDDSPVLAQSKVCCLGLCFFSRANTTTVGAGMPPLASLCVCPLGLFALLNTVSESWVSFAAVRRSLECLKGPLVQLCTNTALSVMLMVSGRGGADVRSFGKS